MPARRDEYQKINWLNGVTKLGETNLQHMDEGIKLNNDLAKENANFIDEIFAAFITQSEVSFNDETYTLTIKFGSATGTDATTRFNKVLTVGIPFIGINTTDSLASSIFADGITLGSNNYRIFRGMYEITYSELKTLKSQSKLIPGAKYRITDYQCVVNPNPPDAIPASSGNQTVANAIQSAGHVFDIIVTALDTNVLDDDAKACLHNGDTYFANSDLTKWKLKYDLEGNKNTYQWIDNTDPNFKGVIFYLKDEHDNECWYDFKNIMFKNSMLYTGSYNAVSSAPYYYYTFTNIVDNEAQDATMMGVSNGEYLGTYNCHIGKVGLSYSYPMLRAYGESIHSLNYIVFKKVSYNVFIDKNCFLIWFTSSNNNTIYNVKIGYDCKKIVIGASGNIEIGNQCQNIEMSGRYYVYIGNNCSSLKYIESYFRCGNNCSNFGRRSNAINGFFQNIQVGNNVTNITIIPSTSGGSETGFHGFIGNDCSYIEVVEKQHYVVEDKCHYVSMSVPKNWTGYCADMHSPAHVKGYFYPNAIVYLKTNTALQNSTTNEVYSSYEQGQHNVYMSILHSDNTKQIYKYDFTTQLWDLIRTEGVVYPVSITHAELLALKNNSKLVPNATYRITDYQCSVVAKQTDTPNGTVNNAIQSAGHQFDIIVKALTTSRLDTNAKACLHEGDTYFANTDFRKWELKYDIDGSIVDCAWVDPTAEDFKGVIFHMKDEYNNECWYDFKNIMYSVNALYQTDAASYIQNWNLNRSWYYTFHANSQSTTIYDASMLGFVDSHPSGAGLLGAKDCHIGLRIGLNNNSNCYANNSNKTYNLNYCVFITKNDGTYRRPIYSVFLDYNCRAITVAPENGYGSGISNIYIGHSGYKMVISGYAGNTGTTIGSECSNIVISSGSGDRVKIGNNSSNLFGIRGRTQIGDRCYNIKRHPDYNSQNGSDPGWFRCGDDCSYIYARPYQNYNSEGTRTVNIGNNCKYITYIDMMNLSVGDNCKYIDCGRPTNWSDSIGAQPTVYIRPNTVSPVDNDYAYLQTNTALAHKEVRSEVYCTYDNTTSTYALFMDVFETDGHLKKFKYDSTTKLWTDVTKHLYKHNIFITRKHTSTGNEILTNISMIHISESATQFNWSSIANLPLGNYFASGYSKGTSGSDVTAIQVSKLIVSTYNSRPDIKVCGNGICYNSDTGLVKRVELYEHALVAPDGYTSYTIEDNVEQLM